MMIDSNLLLSCLNDNQGNSVKGNRNTRKRDRRENPKYYKKRGGSISSTYLSSCSSTYLSSSSLSRSSLS